MNKEISGNKNNSISRTGQSKPISIAIDGPSGAGKSTLSQRAASRFGFMHVDTGAIYRTLGLYVKNCGVSPDDEKAVGELLKDAVIELTFDKCAGQRMLLCGEDVTDRIRTAEVSEYASKVSSIPEVRSYLLDMQRKLAEKHNVIMDGRDIGTVVLKDADLKIFLTAGVEDRAMRRLYEFRSKNIDTDYEKVLQSIKWRDKNDSSRSQSPLFPAEDAVILDTTGNTLDESAVLIINVISERLGL